MEFWDKRKKKKKRNQSEVLLSMREERRLLANVPDKSRARVNRDRRGNETLDAESMNVNDFINQ